MALYRTAGALVMDVVQVLIGAEGARGSRGAEGSTVLVRQAQPRRWRGGCERQCVRPAVRLRMRGREHGRWTLGDIGLRANATRASEEPEREGRPRERGRGGDVNVNGGGGTERRAYRAGRCLEEGRRPLRVGRRRGQSRRRRGRGRRRDWRVNEVGDKRDKRDRSSSYGQTVRSPSYRGLGRR